MFDKKDTNKEENQKPEEETIESVKKELADFKWKIAKNTTALNVLLSVIEGSMNNNQPYLTSNALEFLRSKIWVEKWMLTSINLQIKKELKDDIYNILRLNVESD